MFCKIRIFLVRGVCGCDNTVCLSQAVFGLNYTWEKPRSSRRRKHHVHDGIEQCIGHVMHASLFDGLVYMRVALGICWGVISRCVAKIGVSPDALVAPRLLTTCPERLIDCVTILRSGSQTIVMIATYHGVCYSLSSTVESAISVIRHMQAPGHERAAGVLNPTDDTKSY